MENFFNVSPMSVSSQSELLSLKVSAVQGGAAVPHCVLHPHVLMSFPGALMNSHWSWMTPRLPPLRLRPSLPGPLMDIIRPADQLHAVCDNDTAVPSVSRWTRLPTPAWWTVIHLQRRHAAFSRWCCSSPSLSSSTGRPQGSTKECVDVAWPEGWGGGCCTQAVVIIWKRNTDDCVVFKKWTKRLLASVSYFCSI